MTVDPSPAAVVSPQPDGPAPAAPDWLRTVLLLRHARSTANTAGVLAGRSADVHLDDAGRAQADRIGRDLAGVHIARIVSSPLTRCRETLGPLAAALGLPVEIDDRLVEVDYGSWTGRALSELSGEPLWRIVQQQPSAARFPGGEGLAAVSARAVAAVREHLEAPVPVLICSHGDVLKAILADALGLHLDGFQRINVAPASLSVVRYTPGRSIVERINQTADLAALAAPPLEPAPGSAPGDAAVGGAPR